MEELATVVQNINASRYLSAAGFVVLLYDHVLTFDDEVEYVWKARMSLPKFLFLFNRYLVPTLMNFLGLPEEYFPILCKFMVTLYWRSEADLLEAAKPGCLSHSIWAFSASQTPTVCLTQRCSSTSYRSTCFTVVVLLRLWVLWDRWRNLVVWTLAWFIFTHLATFGMVTWVVVQLQPVAQYDPVVHSCVLSRHIWMEGLWVPGVLFETTVFIAACWNAMARPRDSNELLTKVLYRDGFNYFAVLLIAPLSLTFLSLLLVLNLRRASASDASPDRVRLRMDYEENPANHDHMQMKVFATPADSPCEGSPLECISEETIVEERI
ncbi:hypothetical protein EVG20_g7745 [Dentipellis fragilis]|uniref:DUF6533 domain-containing protein n=1 Tax=Dentipellis fragilis TaxID=205917 RepID=A0A4Y9YDC8_9AGAM|nr:hypothetical protein EVG20_g7745 [Dentipellis fragilis]